MEPGFLLPDKKNLNMKKVEQLLCFKGTGGMVRNSWGILILLSWFYALSPW